MKKKTYPLRLLIYIVIIMICQPTLIVQANVYDFSSLYLEIDVPYDTIVLTKDTPNDDEQWEIAGILDPEEEKENFDTMGVEAIFYDSVTKTTVRLQKKDSTKSKEVFQLSLLTEDELEEFYESMSITDDDTSTTIQSYQHEESLFFRYEIVTTAGFTELIYGTILNGSMIWFDTYAEGNIDVINEEYLQTLVNQTHITQILDQSEVQKSERRFTLFTIGMLLFVIIILGLIIYLRKRNNKRQALLRIQKSEKMTAFFKEQREKEKQNIRDNYLFINNTVYSEAIIKQFTYYNLIFKRIKLWIFIGIFFLLFFSNLYHSDYGTIKTGIGFILIFVFVYIQNVQVEKLVKRTMSMYGNKDMEMNFLFYDDYFTVKGNHSIIKYPYLQLTDIREYKGYLYLYISSEQAFYIKADNFGDLNAFKAFIYDKFKKEKSNLVVVE